MISDPAQKHRIAVLGAGSWGSAIAIHLARVGHEVMLWSRNDADNMQALRQNTKYLPGVLFPDNLNVSSDFSQICAKYENLLISVPSHAFDDIVAKLPKKIQGIAWLTKGLDPVSNNFLSANITAKYGNTIPMCMISGPSFAKEVTQGLPTALILAGNNPDFNRHYQGILHNKNIRVYISDDLVGVQLSGAVKNIIAIGCGISDGLGYGSNARAALITRGLAELSRLGLAVQANSSTFYGLAGIGDMVLTCTDNQSRNRRFGLLIGKGYTMDDAIKEITQVVEGVGNSEQIFQLALKLGVEMPICDQIYRIIKNEISPEQAVKNLMQRPINS